MLFPCEVAFKRFTPAVKAEVARLLSERHSFTQVEIAAELGVTQAAVSEYLSGKYSDEVRKTQEFASVKKAANAIAQAVASDKRVVFNAPEFVCGCCREMRQKGFDFGELKPVTIRISDKCDLK